MNDTRAEDAAAGEDPHGQDAQRTAAATALAIVLAALTLAAAPVYAAPNLGIERTFNWSYAAAYGTGRYTLGGGNTITVGRIPLHWTVHKAGTSQGCRCGIDVLLPVTVGVENLDLANLPHHADELGFFPGVALVLPRTVHWDLKLMAQIGVGKRRADGYTESAKLYGAGIRSRYTWHDAPGAPALIDGLYWSAYRLEGGPTEALARFSNGVEFDVPVPHWTFHDESMRLMPHVLADWYFNPIDIRPILNGGQKKVRLEWELGLAAGRDDPFRIFGAKLDSVGLALRFSDHSHGIRFFVGSIF